MSTHDEVDVSDAPELPDDLRALVGGMQDDPLEEDRVARVRQRLGPVLPPGGGGGTTGSGAGLKLAAIGVVALIGLGAFLHARSGAPTAGTGTTTPAPAETAAPAAPPAPPAPDVVTASAPVLAAADAPSASSASAASAASVARPAVSARAPAEQEDVVAEEDILHRARAALASSPQQALDLTETHAKKFPHGVLTQEREIVAIDALGRLGRSADAATRASRFRTHFPRSPYVQELKNRGLVE